VIAANWKALAQRVDVIGESLTVWAYAGDITTIAVDAIVASVDPGGYMRGDVAAAIKRRGGDEIEEDSTRSGHSQLGAAWSVDGGRLGVEHVILAAAMDWDLTTKPEVVTRAFADCIGEAVKLNAKSIAVPAIGSGTSGLTVSESGRLLAQVLAKLTEQGITTPQDIVFVLYGARPLEEFLQGFRGAIHSSSEEGIDQR